MDKVKFIEETKIKKDAQNEPKKAANTNPIKGNLMKFVHYKFHKNEFKKDF